MITGLLTGFLFFAGAQPPVEASGTISGRVADSLTNLPVEYANILVFSTDTSLVSGGITTNEGIFIISNVPYGHYIIKITFIGYQDVWIDSVQLNGRNRSVYFENILLKQSAALLTQYEVTGQRSVMEMHIDRKVFNVDQSIVSQGQSATEVLETVPSVEVDMDGNVSLRGSGNVTILVDGRPSAMIGSDVATALQQIPASMIESVEIITNPSAKFDPEGMSGIINIKLRKDRKGGVNGLASIGYGTWKKYNASVNLNYRTSKINLFANYSTNNRDYFRTGYTYTTNKQNPDSLFYTDQEMFMKGFRLSHMIRGGADWFINRQNTLTGYFTYNTSNRGSDDTVNTVYRDVHRMISDITNRISNDDGKNQGYNLVLTWQKEFNRPGQELLVDFNYSVHKRNGESLYNDLITYENYLPSTLSQLDNKNTVSLNKVGALQIDYTHPLNTTSIMEAGGRIGYRLLDNDQDASSYDPYSGEWLPDSFRINRFLYDEWIGALYATYAGSFQKFSYKAGLRYEQTLTSGILVNTADTFRNQYPSLFPSVHLSYTPDKSTEFQISYSRRINRPRSHSLNPFADYSDPMNVQQGNPYLTPEYTHSIELGYSRFFKKSSLITSLFYRKVNDQIERFKVLTPEGITISTSRNLSSGIQYGYELIGTYNPFRWWTLNANFNMNQRILDAENIQEGLRKSGLMWSAKMMSTLTLKTGTSVQISGNYSSPRIMTIGVSAPRYGMDIAARQSILKNKGSLSLRVSDVFHTSNWIMSLDGEGFSQEIERYFDSRIVFLTFTYQFGQQQRDPKARKQDERDTNGDDSEEGGEMMF